MKKNKQNLDEIEINREVIVELRRLPITDLIWPFYENEKAWSASKITKFLKNIEYKDIPEKIMKIAADRGKAFHEIIQNYFENGIFPDFVNIPLVWQKNLNPLELRIHESINFLRKKNKLKKSKFQSNEQLHYALYKGTLIASYSDIDFNDYILELKTSSIYSCNNPILRLTFEIQLLIQHLCSGKDIFLLWSTGKGVIFYKFIISENLLRVLDILIEVAKEEDKYSDKAKQIIADKLVLICSLPKFIPSD